MRANELMIGDWLHAKSQDVNSRVIDIEGKDHETEAVWLADKSCWGRLFMNEIEPIPITDKILAKNFEKNGDHYGICNEYFAFGIKEVDDQTYMVNCYCRLLDLPHSQIVPIQYVHELQHVMRLFAIKKYIEL